MPWIYYMYKHEKCQHGEMCIAPTSLLLPPCLPRIERKTQAAQNQAIVLV